MSCLMSFCIQLSSMLFEMKMINESAKRPLTSVTFDDVLFLYVNYKPKIKLKFGDVREAFDDMVLNDDLLAGSGKQNRLTRESFLYAMNTLGDER